MQNRKGDTDVQNRLLDSVGEGEGGMFQENSVKHVYYLGWNRSPAQAGCMRQVLGPGALGRPRGIGWRGRWEGGSRWGIHVNPWLIHVNVWQKPLKYCKVISLQLIKINGKKKSSPTPQFKSINSSELSFTVPLTSIHDHWKKLLLWNSTIHCNIVPDKKHLFGHSVEKIYFSIWFMAYNSP